MAENPTVPIQPGILDERSPGLMALVERFDEIPLEALLVYLIDHVDASVLPYLVDQFDMGDFIRETTNEATTRSMLKSAIDLKRHLGTTWALKFVADALGLPIEVVDWHQADPQLDRHTFIARAWANDAQVPMSSDAQAELIRLIGVAKRYSQHETVQMGGGLGSLLGLAGAAEYGNALDLDAAASGRDMTAATLGLAGATDIGNALDLDAIASGRDLAAATLSLASAADPFQLTELWS